MTETPEVRIGVFGHGARGSKYIDSGAQTWVESFGICVAKSGATLFTGGGDGVMELARRGALAEGGSVVSIHPEDGRHRIDDTSETLGTIIATGQGKLGRVHLLTQSIDLGFSLGGGAGTLVEILSCYLLRVPVIVVEGLGGPADPDPFAMVHDVTELTFGGVSARRGFFDGKDRKDIKAPVFCSKNHSPETILALGHACLRGEI